MSKILEIQLDDPAIFIIRAGIANERSIDDPNDVVVKIIRPRSENYDVTMTKKEARQLQRNLVRLGWKVTPSISPGAFWSAKPPACVAYASLNVLCEPERTTA